MIEKLELKGYNRFFLNNIQYIDYTPKSQIQLILGSNGSGKSSLLKELNPLPINKHEFKDDGYKKIIDYKDSNKYEIYSDKNKCYFKVNDKELNPGGTKKIQLNLIYDHYGLTPKSNNVLLNISKLSTMSTNERKEWLRQMSTVDYSYSIYLYNDLKQKLRDSIGFIKIINNELTSDVSLISNDKDIDNIKQQILILKDEIEYLTNRYKSINTNKQNIDIDYNALDNFNKLISKNIHLLNKDEINLVINTTLQSNKDIEEELERIKKEIDGLESYTKSSEEIILLKEESSNYKKFLFDIDNKISNPIFNKEEYKSLYNLFLSKESEINNIIIELSYYDDVIVTRDILETIIQKKNDLSLKINSNNKTLSLYQGEYKITMDNFKEDNKITCKKCGDISYFGYDKNRQEDLEKKIKERESILEIDNKLYYELDKDYDRLQKKIKLIKLLKDIYLEINLLQYWNIKLKDTIGSLTSQQIYFINNDLKEELDTFKDYGDVLKLYNDLEYKIKLDNDIIKAYQKHVDNNKENLINRLIELQNNKRSNNEKLDKLKNDLNNVIEFNNLYNNFKNVLNIYSNNQSIIIKERHNIIIKNTINKLKSVLMELEDKYNNFDRIKNRVEKNKELIKTHEHRKKVLELTIKALSPTEGLIAKSINSFINKFLLEMNTIINSVWSYDITLLPCQVNDENDLDYMFGVLVDNNQLIEDVSMLSSSMKDIVDLSFRIVFMKYMGLTHMPLILDEFGITMDDKHRYNVYHVIENTLANNFEQVFITAHFKSMYSRFLDSDIIVLDDKNLDLEKTSYNTSIKIE